MFEDLIESRVRPLAEILTRMGLERIRISGAESEIELRRSSRGPAGKTGTGEAPVDGATARAAQYDVLCADLVGRVRFLRPATTVGTPVEAGVELAFIEALGIRNPVRTRGDGRVAVVYVEEGQAVDFGAPLFAIERPQ